jgi:hypothetical protein
MYWDGRGNFRSCLNNGEPWLRIWGLYTSFVWKWVKLLSGFGSTSEKSLLATHSYSLSCPWHSFGATYRGGLVHYGSLFRPAARAGVASVFLSLCPWSSWSAVGFWTGSVQRRFQNGVADRGWFPLWVGVRERGARGFYKLCLDIRVYWWFCFDCTSPYARSPHWYKLCM